MSFGKLAAERTKNMGASAIREILKAVAEPGMISLAGGIPAPESFPLNIMNDLTASVIGKYGSSAFQYGPTEGFAPLRQALSGYLQDKGVTAEADEIIVASGSQGILDCLGKVLISEGDTVAMEAPTYLGAIQAFNPYGPSYARLATDDDGLLPESLEDSIKLNRPKFVYLSPTFQNPTGRTIPLERRKAIASIIEEHDVMLVEDDPYSALRYRGKETPTIKSLAPNHVIYIGTLSKIFAPGLRIGFCTAPESIRQWLVLAKQGVDLHTSTFNQALAAEYLAGGHLETHLPKILSLYKPRQEAMLNALEKYFPNDFKWSCPEGGLFIWAQGPKGLDMDLLFASSLERRTAFVPGKYFYTHPDEGLETMRLNYTMADEETIFKGMKILAETIKSL